MEVLGLLPFQLSLVSKFQAETLSPNKVDDT